MEACFGTDRQNQPIWVSANLMQRESGKVHVIKLRCDVTAETVAPPCGRSQAERDRWQMYKNVL